MLTGFAWKLVGFLPVSVPKGLPFLLLGLEREGLSWKSAVVGFRVPSSAGRTYGKKKRKLLAYLSYFSFWFPSPICLLLSFSVLKTPLCIFCLVFLTCIQWETAWSVLLPLKLAINTSPISRLLNVHFWKQRYLGGDIHMLIFSVDTTKLWQEISDLYHYVNHSLLGTQKSQFLVKIKQFSSISNEWLRN